MKISCYLSDKNLEKHFSIYAYRKTVENLEILEIFEKWKYLKNGQIGQISICQTRKWMNNSKIVLQCMHEFYDLPGYQPGNKFFSVLIWVDEEETALMGINATTASMVWGIIHTTNPGFILTDLIQEICEIDFSFEEIETL